MRGLLLIHGGAWNMPDEEVPAAREALRRVLDRCADAVRSGAPALDLVEQAVVLLEDEPCFNAGRGARLNAAGDVELDACIADGSRLKAGAVGAVRGVRNPVRLARRILEDSPHLFLAGEGARRFARAAGIPMCRTRDLLVGKELERYLRIRSGELSLISMEFSGTEADRGPWGTVGAVAVDRNGRLAAATSTGGTQHKWPGRVGDSPVIGAGTYADDRSVAVSCTGHGESILMATLARRVAEGVEGGLEPARAGRRALRSLRRFRGYGGLIAVDRRARMAFVFNTPRMARGFCDAEGRMRVRVSRGGMKA